MKLLKFAKFTIFGRFYQPGVANKSGLNIIKYNIFPKFLLNMKQHKNV